MKTNTEKRKEKKKESKEELISNDREIFKIINDKTVSNSQVGALLSKYNFTEKAKFDKLYNASINFIKNWKSKMIFEIQDVKKALNTSIYEVDLVPTKLPEHDDPLKILQDYFNTAMRTYIKYLISQKKSPRDFKYIIEINNNQ